MEEKTRKSVIAGSWYPGDPDRLKSMLDDFLDSIEEDDLRPDTEEEVRALISPHAGYPYSGQVAAHGYKLLQGKDFTRVIIMAPSHRFPLSRVSVPRYTHYETPFGNVKVDPVTWDLLGDSLVKSVKQAHAQEHSLEIQLPFLQHVLGRFSIVPLIMGELHPDEIEELAHKLEKIIDENTLVIASSDLSHFHEYKRAVALDEDAIEAIVDLEWDRAFKKEMCGRYPVSTLMKIAQEKGWEAVNLHYANSGDVTGDMSQVVGYASIAFYGEKKKNNPGSRDDSELDEKEKEHLLGIARKTIKHYLEKEEVLDVEAKHPSLEKKKGTFVTLEKNDQLRGCIGNISPDKPVYLSVRDNAIGAAFQDPRFPPLSEEEFSEITIEISVLSVPKKLQMRDPEDCPKVLEKGVDGVMIQHKGRSATFLPQVWGKIPEAEEFLEKLCRKAWLPGDAWKNPETEIFTYRVQNFEES